MMFFPFEVFSLFMFILFINLIGLFRLLHGDDLHRHHRLARPDGVLHRDRLRLLEERPAFLKLFVPSGIPMYILPLVTAIEVMSFLSRPISHSVQLFANMLAGHITLKVFAGFITMLAAWGIAGWVGAVLPLALTVAHPALELLVAVLQAYVFAILTCIYLNDAIHPGH